MPDARVSGAWVPLGKLAGLSCAKQLPPRRAVLATALALAALVPLLGCGDDRRPSALGDDRFVLTATIATVWLAPGGSQSIAFRLATASGVAAANQRLEVSAVDDPDTATSEPAGATLSASTVYTDMDGLATVRVTGGLKTIFQVVARHATAGSATAVVVVGGGARLAIVIVPVLGAPPPAEPIADVELRFFDGQGCAGIDWARPPRPVRPARKLALGDEAELDFDTSTTSAVVGRGFSASDRLIATGCVDLAGTPAGGSTGLRVALALARVVPSAGGTFELVSRFSLGRGMIASGVAATWRDLGDCPLDPAELWLDCAVDALDQSAGDPTDCVSSSEMEGAVARAIGARRTARAATGARCRSAVLESGAASLDARLTGLFPSPGPRPLSELAALGEAATGLLDAVTLVSSLTFEPTAIPELGFGTHALLTASFSVGAAVGTVAVGPQGAPATTARFVPLMLRDDVLTFGAHGLSLRLGQLARAAFADIALAGRNLPRGASAFLGQLFGLASTGSDPARKVGCAAMDAVVCAEIGAGAGCLHSACVLGEAALASALDASFSTADGEGLDFVLSGSASLLDVDNDGAADRLGDAVAAPGLWTAEFRARTGIESAPGTFTGTKVAD